MSDTRYIGVLLALCSSVAIGSSYVTIKIGLKDASRRHGFRGDGHEYFRNPTWWTGMIMQVAGELFNFAAYSFAPAVLVTPLGALSVLTGTVLGAYFLKERLNVVGKLGCAMCLIGSVLIVANAPPDKEVESMDEMLKLAVQPGFLLFSLFTAIWCLAMIYMICPRYGNTNPLYYLSICAGTGAISVMALKAFGIAIKLTFAGSNQFLYFSTYLFGIVAAGCIVVQMNYFNKALSVFPQSIVSPIYYVTFTTAVLAASFILFQGFNVTDNVKATSLVAGFLTIFTGVYLLNFNGSDFEPLNSSSEYEMATSPSRLVEADVLAFVVLGLKCAKEVHNTLSAIKDGPSIVRQLADELLQLHWILEQLRQSRAAALDTALEGQVRQCYEDLCLLAKSIEKLQVAPQERTTGRFWKRLKVVISEDDLCQFNSRVTQKAAMLSLRLNVLSSNAVYAAKDGSDNIQQKLDSVEASMQKQLESQIAGFLSVERNLSSSHSSTKDTLEAGLSSIQRTLDATSSISSHDTASMLQLLNEIKDRISSGSTRHGLDPTSGTGDKSESVEESPLDTDQNILERVNRLCSLIGEKRDAIDVYAEDDDQAESVIEDLHALLQNVRQQRHPIQRSTETNSCDSCTEKSFSDDLRRFGRSFGQNRLSINSRGKFPPKTRTLRETETSAGKLSLIVHKRKRTTASEDVDGSDRISGKRRCTDYTMKLALLPDGKRNHRMLMASITQWEEFSGSVSSISHLEVNRVLPAGSKVFQLVEQGRLDELQEMILDGRASIRDHDEYGASLLFYSMRQPEMCKFLLDSGLSVDHVADVSGQDTSPEGEPLHLLQIDGLDDEMEPELRAPLNECRKLLLRAGADPTESIQLVWNPDIVAPFADINTYRDSDGDTSFLIACRTRDYGYTKEVFHQVLELGANIHDRDRYGRSCLHICLERLHLPHESREEFKTIRYLVQRGADIFATTDAGESVSDIAYTTWGRFSEATSYPGDLWDAVLSSCGYNIKDFRSGYQRKPRYSSEGEHYKYYRHNFEQLWKGREDQCPYWDDKPWPPLEPGESDSDDSEPSSIRYCSSYDSDDQTEWEDESGSDVDTSENRGHFELDHEMQDASDGVEVCQSLDVESAWDGDQSDQEMSEDYDDTGGGVRIVEANGSYEGD
ncbi:hypothetical protein NM208_g1225 [Fusarium decemcellulare]|uniref:Uncharacterized protein n=1 Tax=Fusarium decemcellulare TaxID=57161 RepID=A0ACC1SX28_9HYPO|nr:hypothetical protein NM208_g1225 [Fusarium decemcellulare]